MDGLFRYEDPIEIRQKDATEGKSELQEITLDESKPTLNMLEDAINEWGLARNITPEGGATVMAQMSKMTEEFAEFLGTWDKITERCTPNEVGEWLNNPYRTRPELKNKLDDDFGDMLVCIIQAMRLAGTDMETCLTKAWHDIKDRKGTMINGKFVKETSS